MKKEGLWPPLVEKLNILIHSTSGVLHTCHPRHALACWRGCQRRILRKNGHVYLPANANLRKYVHVGTFALRATENASASPIYSKPQFVSTRAEAGLS